MSSWVTDRTDRADLVRWLAIRADTGGAFYTNLLAHLIDHGSLTAAQETAVRQARARVARADVRLDPSRGQWAAHGRCGGNAEYRAGAAITPAEAH